MADAGLATVSCLTVTRGTPERLPWLRRSVASFRQQTHARRELIVVADAEEADALRFLDEGRPAVRLVTVPGRRPLGALRNVALGAARGEVVCQWDDDDLSHPQRLQHQLSALARSGKPAACLQQVMHFVARDRLLFCANWAATPAGAHPGTLMCLRAAAPPYPETGPRSVRDEDMAVLECFQRTDALCILPDQPHLFVYVTHGRNTQPADHHAMLARQLGQSRGLLVRREAALRAALAPFDFGPGDVTVQGGNGAAFVLSRPGPG